MGAKQAKKRPFARFHQFEKVTFSKSILKITKTYFEKKLFFPT